MTNLDGEAVGEPVTAWLDGAAVGTLDSTFTGDGDSVTAGDVEGDSEVSTTGDLVGKPASVGLVLGSDVAGASPIGEGDGAIAVGRFEGEVVGIPVKLGAALGEDEGVDVGAAVNDGAKLGVMDGVEEGTCVVTGELLGLAETCGELVGC